jgi:MOSC domain-containing protein YiiM
MKLISLNVGKPQPYQYNGKEGYTSIFKTPVNGERAVTGFNISGDEQGDKHAHGGELKAVYAYDVSYYETWKKTLSRDDWSYGMFGENLTTDGLPDDKIYMGDIYKIGTVHLKAVQPRFPCFKLNIRFGLDDMLQRFAKQANNGTYFSIVQEGSLKAGDTIELVQRSRHNVTIQQLVDCYYTKGADKNMVQQILAIDFLPQRLITSFESFA